MNIDDYQKNTSKTAIYPKDTALYYLTLGLVGESGEIANKVKKIIRDENGNITDEFKQNISDELGDILWYVAQLSVHLGISLGAIAQNNLDKLTKRLDRGVIGGQGDNR